MSTTQLPKIPFGWHFNPDDHEIVAILASILDGRQHHLVTKVDVFAAPPWDLFKDHEDDDVWYFFTELKKMSENASKNFKRTVGDSGTWKTETCASQIYDPKTKLVIGSKRYFAFKLSAKRKRTDSDDVSNKFTWGMTEFKIETPNSGDVAICKITRKSNDGSRKDYVHTISKTDKVNSGSFPEIQRHPNSADVNFQEVPRDDYVPTILDTDQVNSATIPYQTYGFSFTDFLSDPAPIPDSDLANVNFQEIPPDDYVPTILETDKVNSESKISCHTYGFGFSASPSNQVPIPESDFANVNFQEIQHGDYVPYGFGYSALISDQMPIPEYNFPHANFPEIAHDVGLTELISDQEPIILDINLDDIEWDFSSPAILETGISNSNPVLPGFP